jgi:hypothetical protein
MIRVVHPGSGSATLPKSKKRNSNFFVVQYIMQKVRVRYRKIIEALDMKCYKVPKKRGWGGVEGMIRVLSSFFPDP